MKKRDLEKAKRNQQIKDLTQQLRAKLPNVLKSARITSEGSLHGLVGGKNKSFIEDIYDKQILTPDEFISLWAEGFQLQTTGWGAGFQNLRGRLNRSEPLREYLLLFLKRTFLREYDSLSRPRPKSDLAEVWIGSNKLAWGLLVTPRFNEKNSSWENDRSEVRHFSKKYWSIGHILETGFVVPHKNRKQSFSDTKGYLDFFVNTLVRQSGSPFEIKIAELYEQYVLASDDPEGVPLLIPEYRYGGIASEHEYRLDFTIFNEGVRQPKVGFELSPWSSHGYLRKIKGMTQKEVNQIANDNFQKEINKHAKFFKNRDVVVQIYSDDKLKDTNLIFEDMKKYLEMQPEKIQLNFTALNDVFGKDIVKLHVK
ncbi:MAG: topoisomerase [Bdellovibrionota bacterium]